MEIRPEVQEFAEAMERALQAVEGQSGKTGWEGKSPIPILVSVLRHINRLSSLLTSNAVDENINLIRTECAHVGNYSMMIHDLARSFRDKTIEIPPPPDEKEQEIG